MFLHLVWRQLELGDVKYCFPLLFLLGFGDYLEWSLSSVSLSWICVCRALGEQEQYFPLDVWLMMWLSNYLFLS